MSGQVVSAVLAFGFDLGGIEARDGWRFKEVDDNGFAALPWFGEAEFDSDAFGDFTDVANEFITREFAPDEDQLAVALKSAGVEVHSIGFESERAFIAAHVIETTPSTSVVINLRELALKQVENSMASKLAVALKVMGITPLEPHPRWTLIAVYD
jgi:hypothetical protein